MKQWIKVNLFHYDTLLIPLNINDIHWTLILIDIPSKTISHFDSLAVPLCNNTRHLISVKSFLESYENDRNIKQSSWIFLLPREIPFQGPASNDCGVFICQSIC